MRLLSFLSLCSVLEVWLCILQCYWPFLDRILNMSSHHFICSCFYRLFQQWQSLVMVDIDSYPVSHTLCYSSLLLTRPHRGLPGKRSRDFCLWESRETASRNPSTRDNQHIPECYRLEHTRRCGIGPCWSWPYPWYYWGATWLQSLPPVLSDRTQRSRAVLPPSPKSIDVSQEWSQ